MGFACNWGTNHAATGDIPDSISGDAVRTAFENSDQYKDLRANREVEAAIRAAELLGEGPYPVDEGAIVSAATSCWQEEDERVNAALYVYEDVLWNAAFDAACTLGVGPVFNQFREGFRKTAVFADWALTIGYEESAEYIDAVEARFGSIREFLAIPVEELKAESDTCADRRAMIAPKGSATWDVGREILPGRWNAYHESDCYWARLAENGDIRDNHFGDALRSRSQFGQGLKARAPIGRQPSLYCRIGANTF